MGLLRVSLWGILCPVLREKFQAAAIFYGVAFQQQELLRQQAGETTNDCSRGDDVLHPIGIQHGRLLVLMLENGSAGGAHLPGEINGGQAVTPDVLGVDGTQFLLGELRRDEPLHQ